jgi:hypothetical protein
MTDLTTMDVRALAQRLKDPIWRLKNLYKIKPAKPGPMIPFVPTPEQMEIIDAIHVLGLTNILILKARQLGMSTAIDLIMADLQIWTAGFQGSIVDEDQKAAALKLKHKVKAAFESMPKRIRSMFQILTSNDSEFAVRLKTSTAEDQISTVFAGKNARGGTNHLLHVSEWGPIQHNDPPRSEEIMTGALPSAKEGIVVIETTWMGGKGGHLWEITDSAMTTRPEDMTAEDFTLFFFPWYNDPVYQTLGNFDQIPADVLKYFHEVELDLARKGTPYTFSPAQKLWYFKVAMKKGNQRYAEFPTTLEECFKAPIAGAIYAALIDQARAEGRIVDFPWSRNHPVFTIWDLGSPRNTRTGYVQFVGPTSILFIDHDTDLDMQPTERVAWMKSKGYRFGGHMLPHDGASDGYSGKSYKEHLEDAGLTDISIVPRCPNRWPGINRFAELLPRITFHKTKCEKLVESLSAYHTRADKTKQGHETDEPVHDWSSHDSDMARQLAEAIDCGLLKDGPQQAMKRGKVISPIDGIGDRARGTVLSALD